MAVRKPIVVTSSGHTELPAGDTLPVSMQDTYDNGKNVALASATDPIIIQQTNASGISKVFQFQDLSGSDYGSAYFNSVGWGLCLDLGELCSVSGHGGFARIPVFQSKRSAGSRSAPTAVTINSEVMAFRPYSHNGTDYMQNAKAAFYVSETQSTSAQGIEYKVEVTKNGTTARYIAFTVANDGSINIFRDVKARSQYSCPFILYALPGPYNHTGTATETKISSDISVPANTLSANSKLKTDILTSCTTTANGKYVIVRFGPHANNTDPVMLNFNFGGVLSQHIFDTLTCRNSNTDKIGFLSWTSSSVGSSSVSKSIAMQAISVDNTVQNYITIWLKNGQTTDDSTLQMLTIEVIP